ncbi:hypothetical protein ANRL1_03168 [Anaerolineae bacterium]|nr:hypothetical protein ANRL1_03168 [Anaerolineae bacterium]
MFSPTQPERTMQENLLALVDEMLTPCLSDGKADDIPLIYTGQSVQSIKRRKGHLLIALENGQTFKVVIFEKRRTRSSR